MTVICALFGLRLFLKLSRIWKSLLEDDDDLEADGGDGRDAAYVILARNGICQAMGFEQAVIESLVNDGEFEENIHYSN